MTPLANRPVVASDQSTSCNSGIKIPLAAAIVGSLPPR
jgi:hypothetical protein